MSYMVFRNTFIVLLLILNIAITVTTSLLLLCELVTGSQMCQYASMIAL